MCGEKDNDEGKRASLRFDDDQYHHLACCPSLQSPRTLVCALGGPDWTMSWVPSRLRFIDTQSVKYTDLMTNIRPRCGLRPCDTGTRRGVDLVASLVDRSGDEEAPKEFALSLAAAEECKVAHCNAPGEGNAGGKELNGEPLCLPTKTVCANAGRYVWRNGLPVRVGK